MKKSKKVNVSIVVLAYNEEDYIGRCLQSIAEQTVTPDEVIVVNNNSTDQTVAIARRYKFAKVINEPRQGMIMARNTGLRTSCGDVVGRIDADTILPRKWVEEVQKAYNSSDSQYTVLSGGTSFVNAPFALVGYLAHNLVFFKASRLVLGFTNVFGSNMVLSRQFIDNYLKDACKNENFHEDIDLSIHLNEANFKVKVVHGLRVQTTLRGIWMQAFAENNRVEIWKNTLLHHGISPARVYTMLGPALVIGNFVLACHKFGKKIQVMWAN